MNKLEKVKKAMLAMQRYSWEQGVAAQAMLEAGETEWTILLAREAVHRDKADGRVAIMGDSSTVTDPCVNGVAIGLAAKETGDVVFVEAYKKLMDWALNTAPRNAEGIVYHLDTKPEFWVDSFYMLPPLLADAGYFDEAMKQINGYWQALFNTEAGLLSHMWDDGKKVFTRKDFWGVGNGWAMAGMARVIDLLPEFRQADKQLLVQRIETLLQNSMRFQRPDALFHDILDNPESFVETNFPQMLAYTVYRGVASGWLTRRWLAEADKIRTAVQEKVDQYGYVQGVCGAPDFARSGSAVEGQSFYILMEVAADKIKA